MAQEHYRKRAGVVGRWCMGAACAACVGVFASLLAGTSAGAAGPAPESVAADSGSCSACHTLDAGFSHPVDVTPSMEVPGFLPLEQGRVTCLTCHDGGMGRGHSVRGAGGDNFLRAPAELGSLCRACHTSGRGAGAHGASDLRAHLAGTDLRRHRAGIDEESLACMGCHDGATASDAGSHVASGTPGGIAGDHPIGVAVDGRRADQEGCATRPAGTVDRRVRLFGRAVGCGSCHSVYAGRENLLVMSNSRSALCTACHVE